MSITFNLFYDSNKVSTNNFCGIDCQQRLNIQEVPCVSIIVPERGVDSLKLLKSVDKYTKVCSEP